MIKCTVCKHEYGGECIKPMPDRTFGESIVYRVIKIAATAHEAKPYEHVLRFYCSGKYFESIVAGYMPS